MLCVMWRAQSRPASNCCLNENKSDLFDLNQIYYCYLFEILWMYLYANVVISTSFPVAI